MRRAKWLPALLLLSFILVLTSACVGRESPLSLLSGLVQRGPQAPTPTLPLIEVTATPTLPLIATAILPTPTLPAAAQPTEPDAIVIGNTNVNLREGPGTNYAVVGTASPGAELAVLGRNTAASWFKVETVGGVQAWIYGPLVQLNIDATSAPVVEAPPPPAGAPAAGQPTGGQTGGAQGGPQGGPLQVSWGIVGVPAVDETNAYHTIAIYVQGGKAPYTYYWGDQQLSGNTFVMAWVRCAGIVATSIRVDSSDGQSVTQNLGFNAFCPTPYGCNPEVSDCKPWSP
mgnify:FL=1